MVYLPLVLMDNLSKNTLSALGAMQFTDPITQSEHMKRMIERSIKLRKIPMYLDDAMLSAIKDNTEWSFSGELRSCAPSKRNNATKIDG